jgi:peroxiredoxin
MKAPDFSLKNARTGETVSLSDFKNKPAVLTFWVSWCPDCQRDLPKKAQFYRSMDSDELAFLTINVTGREHSEDDGLSFMEEFDLPFPVLRDTGTETYEAYKCEGVPTTIVMDSRHNITDEFGDKADFMEILQAISKVAPASDK